MVALFGSESTVRDLIAQTTSRDSLEIAVYNSEDNHVVSGQRHAVQDLCDVAASAGIKTTLLKVDQGTIYITHSALTNSIVTGFHSSCIASALPHLEAWLQSNQSDFNSPVVPFVSSSQGGFLADHESLNTKYWVCDIHIVTFRKLIADRSTTHGIPFDSCRR